jgi:hypothetical protein
VTDLETLLRAVQDLRIEIMGALTRVEERTVPRAELAAQLGTLDAQHQSLERRVETLESDRRSVRTGLLWPALLIVLSAVLSAAVTYAMATRGGV